MTATYPGTTSPGFTTKVDGTSTVLAADPNRIQEEVIAIEATLGVNPHMSTTPSSGGTFIASATTFADLSTRLANIETGIVSDAHTQYVKNTGGSTITISSGSVKGIVVKANASQSANIQEWQNSSGTALAYVNPTGGVVDTVLTPNVNNLFVLNYVFG